MYSLLEDDQSESLNSYVLQQKRPCAVGTSLLDAILLLSRTAATVSTTNLCTVPPKERENVFSSTTLFYLLENSEKI